MSVGSVGAHRDQLLDVGVGRDEDDASSIGRPVRRPAELSAASREIAEVVSVGVGDEHVCRERPGLPGESETSSVGRPGDVDVRLRIGDARTTEAETAAQWSGEDVVVGDPCRQEEGQRRSTRGRRSRGQAARQQRREQDAEDPFHGREASWPR